MQLTNERTSRIDDLQLVIAFTAEGSCIRDGTDSQKCIVSLRWLLNTIMENMGVNAI